MSKAALFVDGMNLYHAIDKLNKHHLKWLNFRALGEQFLAPSEELVRVVYCFSYTDEIVPREKVNRHREYVKALDASGVERFEGYFKKKPVRCRRCGGEWESPEEKLSDVNLAAHLIDGAHRDEFDRAFIVSADSDFGGAVELFRKRFPDKKITNLAPPGMDPPNAVRKHAPNARKIKESHLEDALFPETVLDKNGEVAARRPAYYAPPGA